MQREKKKRTHLLSKNNPNFVVGESLHVDTVSD